MKRHLFIYLCITLFIGLWAKISSAQDLNTLLRDYSAGRFDRVRESLEAYESRYGNEPEYLFLKAVFEQNAEEAFALYQQISDSNPESGVYEPVLWRMCQYYYAKGLYKACDDMLGRFMLAFPDSDHLVEAQQMQRRISTKLGEGGTDEPRQEELSPTVFTIQVAAFGSREGAERGLSYYRKMGLTEAYMREHRVGRQLLYKIWIGEYDDIGTARTEAEELMRKYRLSSYTIVERQR